MHSHPASFQTLQKIFLGVGALGLLISCGMTAKFGSSMSTLHAIGLCLVTIMAAFIMPAIRFVKEAGVGPSVAKFLTCLGIFFLCVEFFADLGYTVGTRDKAHLDANVQTAAYTAEQNNLNDERANLGLWRKQLEDLTAQNAWATTVSADGLRGQLAVMDKDIELETARGGCKSKCRALMSKKADVENRIAVAEQVQDLSKRIEAAKRLVSRATDKAVDTKDGFSAAVSQTSFVAKIYGIATGDDAQVALNPDETRMTLTEIIVAFFIALSITGLPATAFYFGFFGLKSADVSNDVSSVWDRQIKRNEVHNHVTVSDETAIAKLREVAKKIQLPLAAEPMQSGAFA